MNIVYLLIKTVRSSVDSRILFTSVLGVFEFYCDAYSLRKKLEKSDSLEDGSLNLYTISEFIVQS